MARARLLKIGFFENEDLAQLPDKARLLFAGLWLIADRAGRLEDRPLRIRGQVFPYEMVDVEAHLTQLEARGFIERYQIDGTRYIAIPKFLAHQTPHHREAPSKYPAKSQSLGSAAAKPRPAQGKPTSSPSDPVPVPVPVPVSDPVPDPVTRPSRAARSVSATTPDPRFDLFWSAYPRKASKQKARVEFSKINPTDSVLAEMSTALEWQRRQPDWTKESGRFVPHPDRWLRDRRWEDEPVAKCFDVSDANAEAWAEVEARITRPRA